MSFFVPLHQLMSCCNGHTIHFGDSRVVICSEPPIEEHALVVSDAELEFSRAKIVKKVETNKLIALITPNPELAFERLKEQFVVVEAAGGAVLNECGELLMIRLRERWDLPKGHVETGESSREAAIREVEEECGVVGDVVGNEPLAETWHAYDTYGRWELKRTVWWQMQARRSDLVAQESEGITEAEWCSTQVVDEHLKQSYRTIKEVVGALALKMKNCYE